MDTDLFYENELTQYHESVESRMDAVYGQVLITVIFCFISYFAANCKTIPSLFFLKKKNCALKSSALAHQGELSFQKYHSSGKEVQGEES